MHYVYILERKDGEYYIGFSSELQRRIEEHKLKYPCKLLYYEAYLSDTQARERERKLKHYGSAWRALKKRIAA